MYKTDMMQQAEMKNENSKFILLYLALIKVPQKYLDLARMTT